MRPFAVDANAIALFQEERISRALGPASAAVSSILDKNCIALDKEELCLQEWMNCAAGKFPFALRDWINDQLVTGKIRIFPLSTIDCRKDLLKAGLPKDDHKWVKLAVGSNGKIIVSGDVDFLDPTKKRADIKTKKRLRQRGDGPCARYIRKKFGVEILDTGAVTAYLG